MKTFWELRDEIRNESVKKKAGINDGPDEEQRDRTRAKKESKVDEVSKGTLQKYHKKSQDYISTAFKSKDPKMIKKIGKRITGSGRAYDKLKSESKVNELSRSTLGGYIKKATRDVFDKGRADATQDAISKLGGKHKDQEYKKGPERKAAQRITGVDRATRRLMQKGKNASGLRNNESVKTEAMSDAEKKAHAASIAAFKAKGGKVKKLKPGYAQGWTGKDDLGVDTHGMVSKSDTSGFGTKKKIGSMKR